MDRGSNLESQFLFGLQRLRKPGQAEHHPGQHGGGDALTMTAALGRESLGRRVCAGGI